MGITKEQLLNSIRQVKSYTDKKTMTGAVVPVSYSEEEQIIGKWINGKPLYQKTIEYTLNNTSTTQTINYDIENLERIHNFSTSIFDDSNNNIPMGYRETNGTVWFSSYASNNHFGIVRAQATHWAWCSGIAVIQYTKTTDAENSFAPDMLLDELNLNTEATEDEVNDVIGGI